MRFVVLRVHRLNLRLEWQLACVAAHADRPVEARQRALQPARLLMNGGGAAHAIKRQSRGPPEGCGGDVVERARRSECGARCGYALPAGGSVFNPLDAAFVSLSATFPLDLLALAALGLFVFHASLCAAANTRAQSALPTTRATLGANPRHDSP